MFMSDLVKRLNVEHRVDFMALSSYGNKTVSTGAVRIIMDLRTSILNEHVLTDDDFLGFNIPDEWVVGYGLDYDERFRTMPF